MGGERGKWADQARKSALWGGEGFPWRGDGAKTDVAVVEGGLQVYILPRAESAG